MDSVEAGSTLTALLESTVSRWGDCPFLVGERGMVRYGAFQQGVHGLASTLAERGVAAGDRVVVVMPSCPEILYLWFALARLGAIMVPVNPALADVEIAPVLRHVAARALIGDTCRLAAYAGHLAPDLRIAATQGSDLAPLLLPRPAGSAARVSAADPVSLLLTSGTTDLPKVAALSHASFVIPAREFGRWMKVGPADRFFACLPLFHMAGQAFAASAVAAGASLLVVPRFSARSFWDLVRRHRVTLVRHLGEMLVVLCRQPATAGDRDHTLRAVYGGGARPEIADEFERRFGVAVVEGYGLTETNTVLRNELRRGRRGSIGRPLPYCEVRIAGRDGDPLPASAAAAPVVGEIQVRRNPVMMSGYVGAPELTAAVFAGNWFHTGDLGWRDADDWFYFVGRSKDLIRRRGEHLVPSRIEGVLERHPAVALSAVIGVADEVGGEEAKAFVVLKPGCRSSPQDLVAWCRTSLAEFEVPRFFEMCSDLPRTDTHKINKAKLRVAGHGSCYDRAAVPLPL
ncbi:MAG TPA: AMP-binding protein [Thermoanaerobaculia bacterium]|nr:AMP-binding protein [Thermoanaerobaculia bacterium]